VRVLKELPRSIGSCKAGAAQGQASRQHPGSQGATSMASHSINHTGEDWSVQHDSAATFDQSRAGSGPPVEHDRILILVSNEALVCRDSDIQYASCAWDTLAHASEKIMAMMTPTMTAPMITPTE
jgi:hypothetical protein